MASSRTTSGPSDFFQFYQLQNSGQVLHNRKSMSGDHVMDAMAGTSTVITNSSMTPSSPSDSSPFLSTLNPQGRVSKPARRRSRSSRRTPATLVNTDPSNFRAMVQQFTGGPSVAYAAEPRFQMLEEGNISFGLNQQRLNLAAVEAQQQMQEHQRQAHQHQQFQFHHNMFIHSMNRNQDGSLP